MDGHLHNFWFNRTELIPIDESECNVCMNAKYLVDVRVLCHKLQIGIDFFLHARNAQYCPASLHSC